MSGSGPPTKATKTKKGATAASSASTYSQHVDPTLAPFIPGSASLIGERAVALQLAGKKPAPTDVRVAAHPSLETRGGQGLHEGVPTDMGGSAAVMGSPTLMYLQSGLRTTPAFTPFRIAGGEVGGHTGTFVKPVGFGSTHTKGQADAHDELREATRRIATPKSMATLGSEAMAVAMASRQVQLMPSGPEIMTSGYITGALPNLTAVGGALEAPTAKKRVHRETFADLQHDRREQAKLRVMAAHGTLSAAERKRVRLPSPPRDPMATGGGYSATPPTLPALPTFADAGTDRRIAHLSAWMMQPLRVVPQ